MLRQTVKPFYHHLERRRGWPHRRVLSEDAVELSGGASACTPNGQAQNPIRGSLPITDPYFNR